MAVTSKGWRPVNVREAILAEVERRARDQDRSATSVVERILTGEDKPVKMPEAVVR